MVTCSPSRGHPWYSWYLAYGKKLPGDLFVFVEVTPWYLS